MKWLQLIQLRENLQLTQKEIAYKIGVPKNTYSNWELGLSRPKFEDLLSLADFFHVTTDFLLDHNIDDYIVITKQEYEDLIKARNTINEILQKANNIFDK